MRSRYSGSAAISICAIGLLGVGWFVWAGDLEPPAAPAPTMKTIEQAEPRTPISEADLPMLITQSGSYYFTENMTAAGNGITINANSTDVTIDLMGFTLTGGTGRGILCGNPSARITIRNGTITGFTNEGIDCGAADEVVVEDLSSAANDGNGIEVGERSIVRNCVTTGNGAHGIEARGGSLVTGNLSTGNGSMIVGGAGIRVLGERSRIEYNHLSGNVQGIRASSAGDTSNVIIRNSAEFFNVAAGNYLGTVVANEAAMNAATNDLVNVDY